MVMVANAAAEGGISLIIQSAMVMAANAAAITDGGTNLIIDSAVVMAAVEEGISVIMDVAGSTNARTGRGFSRIISAVKATAAAERRIRSLDVVA